MTSNDKSVPAGNAIQRVTALWALSEAALGGALHALKIPFTGIFVGGSAVLFITLLFFLSNKQGTILKATLLVMIVKAVASPYAPVNAYIAMAFQGICGEVLFYVLKNRSIAAFLLGVFSLLQSAFQKIIVVTVVFGQSFWESLDLFADFVIIDVFGMTTQGNGFSLSMVLISMYVSIHILAGIVFGLWASKLSAHVVGEMRANINRYQLAIHPVNMPENINTRGKRWSKKISMALIFIIFISMLILSYVFPVYEQYTGYKILIMTVRSIAIMLLWVHFIGPFLLRCLRRYLKRKEHTYKTDVAEILNLLPWLRGMVYASWQISAKYPWHVRLYFFIQSLFVYITSSTTQIAQYRDITNQKSAERRGCDHANGNF